MAQGRQIKRKSQQSDIKPLEKIAQSAGESAREMLVTLPKMLSGMKRERKKPMDSSIVMIIAFITCFGLLMIWSASMYTESLAGDEFYLVRKQFIFLLIGFAVMYVVSLVDYHYTKVYAGAMMGVITLLLLLVSEQDAMGGASRWFHILGVAVQPSEFAKMIILLFMSRSIEKNAEKIGSLKYFLYVLLFCGFISIIVIRQPALSTGITIAALIVGMYFMAGGNLACIAAMCTLGCLGAWYYIANAGWRSARVVVWLDPWSDFIGDGWQPCQSLMALGSGGLFGCGIGNGRAKLNYLPELQNDYIFSVIGEELGLIGCLGVLAVYFVLIYKLIKLSFAAPDTYGRMIACGYAVLLGLQVALNVAVVTNSIPSTGVMLPFVSAGGSSLIALMLGLGVVMNVSRQVKREPTAARGSKK